MNHDYLVLSHPKALKCAAWLHATLAPGVRRRRSESKASFFAVVVVVVVSFDFERKKKNWWADWIMVKGEESDQNIHGRHFCSFVFTRSGRTEKQATNKKEQNTGVSKICQGASCVGLLTRLWCHIQTHHHHCSSAQCVAPQQLLAKRKKKSVGPIESYVMP